MKKDTIWDDRHRPWALPKSPWNMKQTWSELLFAHYPIKLKELRNLVPNSLPLDSFDGIGWISVVPFQMSGVRFRGLPAVPGTDRFPELNIRTYVTLDGKPGVYFFNLDAANMLAVWAAKRFYHLPYQHAEMKLQQNGKIIHFDSKRTSANDARLICNYEPVSEPFLAEKGSFDEWVTERYCFYTVNKKGLPLRCDILHQPWQLQQAKAEFIQNTILAKHGIKVESDKPILHFSKKIDVRAWPLVRH